MIALRAEVQRLSDHAQALQRHHALVQRELDALLATLAAVKDTLDAGEELAVVTRSAPYLVTIARAAELMGLGEQTFRDRLKKHREFARFVLDVTDQRQMVNTIKLAQWMAGTAETNGDELSARRQRSVVR